MELGFSIFMLIFGGCIFIVGLDIMYDKYPFLPPTVKASMPDRESYKRYLGKMVLFMSCPFFISGFFSIFISNLFANILVLFGGFLLFLIIGIKIIREK